MEDTTISVHIFRKTVKAKLIRRQGVHVLCQPVGEGAENMTAQLISEMNVDSKDLATFREFMKKG